MNEAFERAWGGHGDVFHEDDFIQAIGLVLGEMEKDFDTKLATLQKQIDELRRALVADGVEHEREAEAMSVGAAVSRDIYGRHP